MLGGIAEIGCAKQPGPVLALDAEVPLLQVHGLDVQGAVDIHAEGGERHGGVGGVQRGERIASRIRCPGIGKGQRSGEADRGAVGRAVGVAGVEEHLR